jgi:hypothetical protein
VTKVKQRRSSKGRATPGHRKQAKRRSKTQDKAGRKHRGAANARRPKADPPVRVVRIRPLDPQAKCGPGTSVERLYRVDVTIDGAQAAHLVFFDRHGLYCEHGRSCPAVDDVRRAHRNLDWTK